MMFSKDFFAARLKAVRNGLTQAQAAEKVGLSQQGWARYESGKVLPGAEAIHLICSNFGVSSDWLLGLPSPTGNATATDDHAQAVSGSNITINNGQPLSPMAPDCLHCKYKTFAEAFKAIQTPI